MAKGPDPLGKRAIFWMPVDSHVRVDDRDATNAIRGMDGGRVTTGSHRARPSGKRALYSSPTPAGDDQSVTMVTPGSPPTRGRLSVECSSCGSVSRVGIVDFVTLQLPVSVWLPWRTFDRWMTCPACRRRTWTSVSITR